MIFIKIGAADSEDIIWKNLGYDLKSRTWRHIGAAIITYLIIAGALLIGFGSAQPTIPLTQHNLILVQGISFMCQEVFLWATFIVFILVPNFAEFEKYHRKTRMELFVFIRLFVFDLFTVIAIPCLSFGLFMYGREENDLFFDAYIPSLGMIIEMVIFRLVWNFLFQKSLHSFIITH